MNKLLVALMLIFPVLTYGQDEYEKLDDEAWKAYETENYTSAIRLYKNLIENFSGQNLATNMYNIACCYALDNQVDSSFVYLNKSLENGFWERANLVRTDTDIEPLRSDDRWQDVETFITSSCAKKVEEVKQIGSKYKNALELSSLEGKSEEELYSAIKNLNSFQSYKADSTEYIAFWHHYNDSTDVPYLVQLPKGYDSSVKYPLLFQLHGGIWRIETYPLYLGEGSTKGFDRFASKWASENGYIMVIPMASRYVNWLYPNDGIDLLPRMLSEIKTRFNVSDNQVFINGHSNGGSGSFSYAMKRPSEFAGFFGFNTNPKVYTGGTFLLNLKNRMFHSVSTDLDYYYPQTGNDSLVRICEELGLNYSNDYYTGFPHWFPEFDESEEPTIGLFEIANKTERNPFPKELYWECDDLENNQSDWLVIEELDTLADKKSWHQQINFQVTEWRDIDDETIILEDVVKDAFDFPLKSGAVKASYANNLFTIETSRVGKIKLLISPEMVNLKLPIEIMVNGKKQDSVKSDYNDEFLLSNFRQNHDRTALWVNEIVLEISE